MYSFNLNISLLDYNYFNNNIDKIYKKFNSLILYKVNITYINKR